MEKKKEEIAVKWREVTTQMRVFTINDLTVRNRKVRYPTVSEKIETFLANLLILYQELFDMIADKNGDEMKAEQEKCTQQEGEIKHFLSKLEERFYDLEEEEASKDKASVPVAAKSVAGFEQVMKEQLEDSKRREEEEKCTRQEKEGITKEITEAKLHVELKDLKAKAEFISSLATKIPLGTWKNVEDKVDKLKQRTTDLIAHTAKVGIILDDVPGWPNTELAVSQAEDSVQEASNELKFEDPEQEMHSNATSVKEKIRHHLFEGKKNQD